MVFLHAISISKYVYYKKMNLKHVLLMSVLYVSTLFSSYRPLKFLEFFLIRRSSYAESLVYVNKIRQQNQSVATLLHQKVSHPNQCSIITILGKEKSCPKKNQGPNVFQILGKGSITTEGSLLFCFHRKILSLKIRKTFGLIQFFFQLCHRLISFFSFLDFFGLNEFSVL